MKLKIIALTGALTVAGCASTSHDMRANLTGNFNPPEQLAELGRVFRLDYKEKSGDIYTYEYTADGEKAENRKWKTLITIKYSNGVMPSPAQWATSFKSTVARDTQNYSVGFNENRGFAKVIYEPDQQHPVYEADAFRTYHIPACGGMIAYAFAIQDGQPAGDQKARQDNLKRYATEADHLASALAASTWVPDCDSPQP